MIDFYNEQAKRNRFVEKSLSIIITIGAMLFISFYIIVYALSAITSIYTNVNFVSKTIQMQFLFVLSLITIIIGLSSLRFLDKSRWPLVNGKIVHTYVARNIFSFQKLWTIKHTYQFEYKEKEYFKTFYDKVFFLSEDEANFYVQKNFTNKKVTLLISVLSYYPKISSETSKMNIAGLVYFYAVLYLSSIFFLIGFAINLIQLNIMKVEKKVYIDGSTNYYLVFPKSLESIYHLEFATLVIPIIIFIVAIIFIAKIIKLYVVQKLFFYIPRVNPLTDNSFDSIDSNVGIYSNELYCPSCNTLNDTGSIYCSNCGQRIN